jgi:MFS family permease
VSGILVLVWINGLMAVGRQFAGVFVHKFSPNGMLVGSAVLSALGLLAMSHAGGAMLFGAATVFALGVCFFWPTMLGYVNENFPRTGALGLAIMGGAGMLSVSIVLPVIGRFYDQGISSRLHTADPDLIAKADPAIQAAAGLETLGKVAVLPAILFVVFLVLLLSRRAKRPATA